MFKLPRARFICGPLAVIESDPAAVTTLARIPGMQMLQVVVLCNVEPPVGIRSSPYLQLGSSGLEDEGGSLTKLGFANWLDDDACASVVTSASGRGGRDADIGGRLGEFRNETKRASSPVCPNVFVGCPNLVDGEISGFRYPFIQQNRNTRLARDSAPQHGEPEPPSPNTRSNKCALNQGARGHRGG
jgi:hypothetical protein